MNFNQLIDKFNAGINWNAYLYAIYKITSTFLVFLLYYKLDSNHFAAWANIQSIIFLILLWADFGLRKSIPRYCPEFSKNSYINKRFINGLIIFQLSMLFLLTPLVLYLLKPFTNILHIDGNSINIIIPVIFILEGIISLLRLIYHAHFKQKFFNLFISIMLMTETILNAFLIFTLQSTKLVFVILINKALISSIVITALLSCLKIVYKEAGNQSESIDSKQLTKDFIKHSGVMWLTTSLRSLSERNFMVPFLTYTAGPVVANIFKVANDGALVFQRIVLKTIGTTDTSLLSYVQVGMYEKKLTEVAFKKLATKMAALCLPFLGLIALIIGWFYIKTENTLVFHIFCIISISYLIEAMLLPYERLLEVKRAYKYLLSVYFFYFLLLLILMTSMSSAWIGLRSTIALLCCVRLVSMFIISFTARTLFNVRFPFGTSWTFIKRIMIVSSILVPLLYLFSLYI